MLFCRLKGRFGLAIFVVTLALLPKHSHAETTAERMARFEAAAMPYYTEHLVPLIDECLTALRTGAPDMASLAGKGLTKTAFGIQKKLGKGFENKVTFMHLAKRSECIISAPNVGGGAVPLAKVLSKAMSARGFKESGAVAGKPVYRFQRGTEVLLITGATGGAAVIKFAKP